MILASIRELLGLPKRKEIVYYPDRQKQYTEQVVDIEISENYDSWSILKIVTDKGSSVFIHSNYLQSMQSPLFISEMRSQEIRENAKVWFEW